MNDVEDCLGNNPKSIKIVSKGQNNGEICGVQINIDFEVNFYITPADDDGEGFTPNGGQIDIFSTIITLEPNDEIEEEEEVVDYLKRKYESGIIYSN